MGTCWGLEATSRLSPVLCAPICGRAGASLLGFQTKRAPGHTPDPQGLVHTAVVSPFRASAPSHCLYADSTGGSHELVAPAPEPPQHKSVPVAPLLAPLALHHTQSLAPNAATVPKPREPSALTPLSSALCCPASGGSRTAPTPAPAPLCVSVPTSPLGIFSTLSVHATTR